MHIAIDSSRITLAQRTGTENYALQLIRALLALDAAQQHRFTLYFRDAPPPGLLPDYPNVTHRVIPLHRAWTHLRFAAALFADRPDVAFVPAHTLPFLFPGRAVVTIHDLGYRFFPEAHPTGERLYLDLTTRYSARRAARIVVDSQATRADLAAQYGVKPTKMDVIYPGVEGLSRAADSQIAAVRAKYRLPTRYLLFVGTLQPRKNILRLVQAFAHYVEASGDLDLGLVLAGKPGWLMNLAHDVLPLLPESARARVVATGYVDDADIAALYSGALALTLPSLYEGFGFPVLEAMRCATPVLCTNISSLPELVGDAALLVDPLDVEAITAGIARLIGDAALRATLIRRGCAQAAQFTWARAAGQTLNVLEKAART